MRSFRVTYRTITNIHGVHRDGGLSPHRTLRLGVGNTFPTRILPIIIGLTGIAMKRTRNSVSTTREFVIEAIRVFIPLANLVGIRRRVTGLRARLTCRRGFLSDIHGGLSGRGFITGTPRTIITIREGGRTSSLSGVRDVATSLGTLGGG